MAKDDHAGPTGIFHNCSGGCTAQFVEMGGPTTRPARSEPRNTGHSGWARLFAYFSPGLSAVLPETTLFILTAASDCLRASIRLSAVGDQRQCASSLYAPVIPSLRSKAENPKPASANARAVPVRTIGRRLRRMIADSTKASSPIGTIR